MNEEDNTEEVVKKGSSESLSYNTRHYDTAKQKLNEIRDKITKAGKYSERYRDVFSREVPDDSKFPLSAQCRDTMELYRKVAKGDKGDNSPSVNLKHLTTEKMKLLTSKSNATNDLNKQSNALIGFKLLPGGTHRSGISTSPLTPPKTPIWNRKLKDLNIYHVTSTSNNNNNQSSRANTSTTSPILNRGLSSKQPMVQLSTILSAPPTNKDTSTIPDLLNVETIINNDTNAHLIDVESIISKLDEKEKRESNMRKFEDLLKKFAPQRPPTKPAVATKEQTKTSREQIVKKTEENNFESSKKAKDFKLQEHILDQIKTCSEVEDLQKGVSDSESEPQEQHFKRETKERKSLDHRSNEKPPGPPLNRTASDAQDQTLNGLAKRRTLKDRSRKVRNVTLSIYYVRTFNSF